MLLIPLQYFFRMTSIITPWGEFSHFYSALNSTFPSHILLFLIVGSLVLTHAHTRNNPSSLITFISFFMFPLFYFYYFISLLFHVFLFSIRFQYYSHLLFVYNFSLPCFFSFFSRSLTVHILINTITLWYSTVVQATNAIIFLMSRLYFNNSNILFVVIIRIFTFHGHISFHPIHGPRETQVRGSFNEFFFCMLSSCYEDM